MRDDGNEGFDPDKRQLRCFAHEMQIAVKGLLFGPNVKELEKFPAMANVTEAEKREYAKKKWRSFGAVGRLHNVTKYIHGSPQRREGYSLISHELKNNAQKKLRVPIMDNDTRWGSVMDMVEYGLENRVHIDIYCRDIEDLEDDRLTLQDWEDLKAVFSVVNYELIMVDYHASGSLSQVDQDGTREEYALRINRGGLVGI